MDIKGRVIQILPEASGESARGQWVRGGFVIETDDAYPKKVAFRAFGEDKMNTVRSLAMNSEVVVTFSPESREFNERWYTDLNFIRLQPISGMPQTAGQPMAATQPAAQPMQQAPVAGQPAQDNGFAPSFATEPDNDLPF